MATLVATPVRTRTADDIYFTTMSVIMLAVVVIGFAPTYFLRGAVFGAAAQHPRSYPRRGFQFMDGPLDRSDHSSSPPATFACIASSGTQARSSPHAWVVLGIMGRHGSRPPLARVPSIFTTPQFILINDLGISLFGALVACAVWQRRNGPVHKRLMLIATIGLMPPASTRFGLLVHKPSDRPRRPLHAAPLRHHLRRRHATKTLFRHNSRLPAQRRSLPGIESS